VSEQHSTYQLADVPASPTEHSRFLLAKTAAGWSAQGGPAGAMTAAYSSLLADRLEVATRFRPETVTVVLKAAAVAENGDYVELPRGTIVAVPEYVNVRPTKLGGTRLKGAALLDALFAG
jgi:hypothetical protein